MPVQEPCWGPPKHRTWSVPESPMIPPRQLRPSRAPSGSKSAKSKLPSTGSGMQLPRAFRKHEMYQTIKRPPHRFGCPRTGSGVTPQLLATLSATFRIFDFCNSALVFLQIGSDTPFSAFCTDNSYLVNSQTTLVLISRNGSGYPTK